MTRLEFFFTANLTDPKCEPRHVATVVLVNGQAWPDYIDAREIDDPLAYTMIVNATSLCEAAMVKWGGPSAAADALCRLYAHGNVWARMGEE